MAHFERLKERTLGCTCVFEQATVVITGKLTFRAVGPQLTERQMSHARRRRRKRDPTTLECTALTLTSAFMFLEFPLFLSYRHCAFLFEGYIS